MNDNTNHTVIEFDANRSFAGLWRIGAKGPWRTEYKTDSMLDNGTYKIIDTLGEHIGYWIQKTLYHELQQI